MGNKTKEIKSALVEVRSAYRLLYAFHKRAKDTIDLIASQFETHTYYKSTPTYNDVPTFRTNPHADRWLWDLFPAYNYSMFYVPDVTEKGKCQSGKYMLEIRLICDTEYAHKHEKNKEPTPLDFKKPSDKDSDTGIYIVFWKCDKSLESNTTWMKVWYNNDYPENDNEKKEFDYAGGKFQVLDCFKSITKLTDKDSIEAFVKRAKKSAEKELLGD